LFGAVGATSDNRKGFHLLQSALKDLSQSNFTEDFDLVVFGTTKSSEIEECGFKVHYLGHLSDDTSLVLAYSAADIFVAPSTQENLANTVLESIACGTPCVAFRIGGMPDLIEHKQNGYLAQPFDITDLAKGIVWIMGQNERYHKLSNRAREKVNQEFTIEIQAKRTLSFYKDIIGKV
jgi:glycosyltransferase involved in cell wall biosynthesis